LTRSSWTRRIAKPIPPKLSSLIRIRKDGIDLIGILRLRIVIHFLAVLTLITSLGATHAPDSTKAHKAVPMVQFLRIRFYQIGRASWYGRFFHGKKTASGEPFNMFEMTAAHPALPLGTLVLVTNLHNHRSVVVRINDRGPVPKSRIIDLSYGAAQELGLRVQGIERVRLDVLEPETVAAVNAMELPEVQ